MTAMMLFETTPETTANAATVEIKEWTERGKYGRQVRHFGAVVPGKYTETRVVVFKQHKVYIDAYGADKTYMVNDWQKPLYVDGVRQDDYATGKLVEVRTLAEARRIAERFVREGIAAGRPARG